MLAFPPNSHRVEFWSQFSDDPAVFRAQVITGVYYEISLREPVRPDCANEVGLSRLVQSFYGKWRFNPTYVEQNLGPALTKALQDYHREIQRDREEREADGHAFEEELRLGHPTPPVGDYYWYELRSCSNLSHYHRYRLWGRALGYPSQIE